MVSSNGLKNNVNHFYFSYKDDFLKSYNVMGSSKDLGK
jgi:hypothetical protein